MTSLAGALVWAAIGYVAIGVPFGLVFVLSIAPRLDPAAREGSILFRVVVLPAAALLWPLVVGRAVMAFRERSRADLAKTGAR
ncbi:MAG: hypothetical protein IT379_38590 [Deltaproteobacteria bacterium]|nr:hypothetical protein [Deltaproteobacteria bacterium]